MTAHRLAPAACAAMTLFATTLLVTTLTPTEAHAFCGFYVAGADASLTNNATMVVMMREGTRTVLSMQNDYQGPPNDFALVVPVPMVIDEENVRTLPTEVFDRIDRLASPRLVEYWEIDPCWEPPEYEEAEGVPEPAPTAAVERSAGGGDLGVTVEAQFEVGEYEIVILSANDSSGLETWLQREEYNIPEGASEALRPYVEQGTKFFVARVNVERVTFQDGRALLSPLRVHYDTDTFALPVRLGLLNSSGTQDLVVHVLAPNQRYDVANYPNVTIPTNLDVSNEVRERFPEFYAQLFDATLERNPGAVVTEYSWAATSCDPCPGPTLTPADLMTLGADVVGPDEPPSRWGGGRNWTLTRLHYRYGTDGLDEDLVFREAGPIVGGREVRNGEGGLEHGATESSFNNFQGRYAIRHPWEGEIACENPIRGRWGGPPGNPHGGPRPPTAAQNTAFATRGELELPSVLHTDAPEIGVEAGLSSIGELIEGTAQAQAPEDEEAPAEETADAPESSGCGACAVGQPQSAPGFGLALLLGLALVWRRARR